MLKISGGKVILRDRVAEDLNVYVENGLIAAVTAEDLAFDEQIDAAGRYVSPGFIEMHTHGGGDCDFLDGTPEAFLTASELHARYGVTTLIPTATSGTLEDTLNLNAAYEEACRRNTHGADMPGLHLEGPFLAKEYKGAMPEHLLKKNDIPLVRHYQELAGGKINYITISPELDGVQEMIPTLKELGIVVGIGHSGATYDQAMSAIAQGATVGTHVGNASRLFHQHEPAIFGAIMESDVYCETICDGRHLVPGSVRMYAKCKGLDRIVAITDSIMAAGLPDGNYHLGVNDVVVIDGDAKLASNGTRAGSTLTQDVALKNMLKWLPNTLEEILPTLSENPAKEMGLWDRKGSIETGKDADLVLLDEEANVVHVFARGKQAK